MTIAGYDITLRKREKLTGLQAAVISILAVVFALVLFSLIFIQADANPFEAYKEIFDYAFFNPFGLPLTLNRFIFLLLCTCAFIIPFRAGLWNIGMTGQLYVGALGAYAVLYAFGVKGAKSAEYPALLIIPLMLIAAAVGGMLVGVIAGYLRGKYNVNEIVVTMMLNFITFWFVSFMIKDGGIFMNPGGRGESFELPKSLIAPLYMDVPFTLILALGVAFFLYWMFAKTKLGYKIRAYGSNPAAAEYSGISGIKIPVLVFLMGGALAGWAGYHYFAAVPGVYKIARTYAVLGDLAFYGIICGLISLGNPIAAIPVALLFGGLTNGGRYVQGKMKLGFGIDYALLGVLMITLVAFQFFYRYQIVMVRKGKETSNE
jgi:general nucleoside transport system permease protein